MREIDSRGKKKYNDDYNNNSNISNKRGKQ